MESQSSSDNSQNNQANTEEPLVSIIVITYNSAKYVLETLESAKIQTYKNIELIISDDCSNDSTITLCNRWIRDNHKRFSGVNVVTSDINTGIAPNCNRGLKAANGLWIKTIAGDDILEDECIEINMQATKMTDCFFLFSKFHVLSEDSEKKGKIERMYESSYNRFSGNQLDNLMNYGYYFPTVTFFGKRMELAKIGFFNEAYPYQEDYPMWFKILKSGYNFHFINNYTVKYRIDGTSIYNNVKKVVNPLWHKSNKKFFYNEILKERICRKQYLEALDTIIYLLYLDLTIAVGNKPGFRNQICKVVKILSPIYSINIIKRLF